MKIRDVIALMAGWAAALKVVTQLAIEVVAALVGISPQKRWRDYDEED